MGKPKKSNLQNKIQKKVTLEEQIVDGKVLKTKNREKFRLRAEESEIVDSKTSQKILSAARQQQYELQKDSFGPAQEASVVSRKYNLGNKNSEENDDILEETGEISQFDFYDEMKINDEDEKAIEMFQNREGKKTKTLTDMINERIAQKQSDINCRLSDGGTLFIEEIDPKIREMYEGVRDVMKRYRSGKVPKAFKIIPKLKNWEQVLFITEPHSWTAAAIYQGTRIFCSVLSKAMAQRFYNLVLLPRIRDDLSEYKKLNMHLYNALKKALFQPAAFMRGIILPLLESGDCTLREAIIFGSILSRNTIPLLHSSACLFKICGLEYAGANSIFIRTILDKRYALPYIVIDGCVDHFIRFEIDKRQMPVLWHQSLLTFVQRYKNDISSEQKEALLRLLRKQSHPKITPEIRRELQAAKCRDVEMIEPYVEQSEMRTADDCVPDVVMDDDATEI